MIAHFIQWRINGRTVSPIEPSEAMHTLERGAVNAGFIFFALALLATMIFGRFVCGWGCHILALQDLCGWMMKRIGITPRPFRSRLLMFVPLIAALYMFVWPTVRRLFLTKQPGAPFPPFTNHIITTDFWGTFPPVGVAIPFLLICGFATVYFLGAKGFCTYACPYGGFFGLLDNVAPGKIRVTDACIQCGDCTAVCTSNVSVHAEVRDYKMVVNPGCMKCMDCVSVCPTDALYYGFGTPAIAVRKDKSSRSYSLSWPEEVAAGLIFLACFLAFRGAYGLVPFLMALGAAAVATFLVIKSWHLLRKADLSLHQTRLKTLGMVQPAGHLFAGCAAGVFLLTTHTGWIRYHESRGDAAFQHLQIADELALAQLDPGVWISTLEREAIGKGRGHLQLATRCGLLVNSDALARMAWFSYLSGNPHEAIALLHRASAHQRGPGKALSLYYAGAIQNGLGRCEEARSDLQQALAERDDMVLAWQELGASLWQLGRHEEAIAAWSKAVERNPRLPLALYFLAGATDSLNRDTEAAIYQRQANENTPRFAAYSWMLGLRLQNLGMNGLADAQFQRAAQIDPSFVRRRP